MRKRLIRLLGQRCVFRAVFIRFGKHYRPVGKPKQYMLIEDVVDERGRAIADHLWMPLRVEECVSETFRRGDLIQFEAEVNTYFKGSKRHRILDYGLRKPMNLQKIEQDSEQEA